MTRSNAAGAVPRELRALGGRAAPPQDSDEGHRRTRRRICAATEPPAKDIRGQGAPVAKSPPQAERPATRPRRSAAPLRLIDRHADEEMSDAEGGGASDGCGAPAGWENRSCDRSGDSGGSSSDEDSGEEAELEPAVDKEGRSASAGLLHSRADVVDDLRRSWLFASVVHFCNAFKATLDLPVSTGADRLEQSLLCPDAHPTFLARLHLRLVAPDGGISMDEAGWEERVKRAWGSVWRGFAEEDVMYGKRYADLSPGERCLVLHVLCEHLAGTDPAVGRALARDRRATVSGPPSSRASSRRESDAPRLSTKERSGEGPAPGPAESVRSDVSEAGGAAPVLPAPLGEDAAGRLYYHLGPNECWVFRVDPGGRRGRRRAVGAAGGAAVGTVEVVCTDAEGCRAVGRALEGRESRERALKELLEGPLSDWLEVVGRDVERRAGRDVVNEAGPSKRSGRLARIQAEAEAKRRAEEERWEAECRRRREEEEGRQTREREERLRLREAERARRLAEEAEWERRMAEEQRRVANGEVGTVNGDQGGMPNEERGVNGSAGDARARTSTARDEVGSAERRGVDGKGGGRWGQDFEGLPADLAVVFRNKKSRQARMAEREARMSGGGKDEVTVGVAVGGKDGRKAQGGSNRDGDGGAVGVLAMGPDSGVVMGNGVKELSRERGVGGVGQSGLEAGAKVERGEGAVERERQEHVMNGNHGGASVNVVKCGEAAVGSLAPLGGRTAAVGEAEQT